MLRNKYIAALATAMLSMPSYADTIYVTPESGPLQEAIDRASPGDVISLAPGEYTGSIRLSDGLELVGSDEGISTIVGDKYAVIHVDGNEVIIRNLEIRGGKNVRRGINADSSIRVEGCTFIEIPEAVALMGSPLTDVLECIFENCNIGVRAIGGSCPTVWGCVFRGGKFGVFAIDGTPYICNCVFVENDIGVLAAGDFRMVMVRNSIFVRTKDAAIEGRGGDFMGFSGITNCIFHECEVVLRGLTDHVSSLTHSVLSDCGDAPFVTSEGGDIDTAENGLVYLGLAVDTSGPDPVKIGPAPELAGKGEALPCIIEAKAAIGPNGIDGATLPIRFRARPFVVNWTSEQYVYMRFHGMQMVMQSVGGNGGRMYDTIDVINAGERDRIVFDLVRYWGRF